MKSNEPTPVSMMAFELKLVIDKKLMLALLNIHDAAMGGMGGVEKKATKKLLLQFS